MTDFDSQLMARRSVMLFFASICAISTMATAIVPFVAYA